MHSVAPTPGRVPAAILAILVHLLFFALLIYGIHWKTHAPEPVAVELWQPPPIAERSHPVTVPKPQVEEKVTKLAPPIPDPDIALAEKKRKRQEQKTQEAERLMLQQAQQKLAELKLKQQQEKQKQAEQKLNEQKQARLQKQVQQKILAEQQMELQKQIERQKVEQQKKQAAALRQMIAQQNQSAMKAEAAQALNNSRQAALASKQSAEQSKLRAEFKDKIKAKIRSKIILPDGLQGNPLAKFEVRVLPTGEVVQVKLVHPSGQPAYDDAVERAIRKATPLPMPPDPTLVNEFRDLNLDFSPKEN